MLVKEAIEMLKRMNPDIEVFLKFEEDVNEYRNNERLKTNERDIRDLHYRHAGDR